MATLCWHKRVFRRIRLITPQSAVIHRIEMYEPLVCCPFRFNTILRRGLGGCGSSMRELAPPAPASGSGLNLDARAGFLYTNKVSEVGHTRVSMDQIFILSSGPLFGGRTTTPCTQGCAAEGGEPSSCKTNSKVGPKSGGRSLNRKA